MFIIIIMFCVGLLVGIPIGIYAAVSWAKGIVERGDEHKFVRSVEAFRKKRKL